jgi:hypothetical protein
MTGIFKKTVLATALAATTLATATPAAAQTYRGHGDGAGAAVAAGIFGLAIGAIIASSGSHHHERYAEGGYGYHEGWTWREGYYWDRDGHRYDRDGRPCDRDEGYYRRGYGDQRGYNGYPGQYQGQYQGQYGERHY